MTDSAGEAASVVLEVDKENKVVYRTMTSADGPSVGRVVATAFATGEPVASCVGSTERDWLNFVDLCVALGVAQRQ
jgi:hypothetical protein